MENIRYFENNAAAGADPLSVCQCGWERCVPGYAYGPCVRDHYLIHYIASGSGSYTVGEKNYRLHAGQGFLIHPGVSAYYQADTSDPWEYYWVGFRGSSAREIVQSVDFSADDLVFEHSDISCVRTVFEDLLDAFGGASPNRFALIGRLYLFFALIASGPRGENGYAQAAADYMRANFSYSITVADAARYVGLSRSYFFRLFKACYRQSPQEYLLAYRLSRAQELLLATDLNVTEIACSCGFGDVSHFSAIFRRRMGESPAKYRRRMK